MLGFLSMTTFEKSPFKAFLKSLWTAPPRVLFLCILYSPLVIWTYVRSEWDIFQMERCYRRQQKESVE